MRAAVLTVCGLLAVAAGGCAWLDKTRPKPGPKDPAANQPLPAKPADQFVTYLNQQAASLQSVRYDEVSLKVSGPTGFVPRLNEGTLACSKPRNFRLMSGHTLTNGSEVDVGSNSDQFWLFVKRAGPEPLFLYCSHADFEQGKANLPGELPFEPDWVLQALGMMTYPAGAPYRIDVDQKERAYTLSWDARTPRGEAIVKAVTFAGDRAGGDRPQVMGHAVKDATGRVLATATVREVRTIALPTDPPSAVQVPTRLVLAWPPQKFTMDMELGFGRGGGVNKPMTDEENRFFFVRPRIDGANPINLATATFRPTSYRGAAPSATDKPRRFGAWRW